MLIFHASNKTEDLAAAMAHIMNETPLGDPFVPEQVLIQSAGMGTWINQQLALHNGAAVQVDSVHPAKFIWQIVTQLLGDESDHERFEKNSMRWEILRILPEKIQDARYAPLHDYLRALGRQNDGKEPDEAVLFDLAEALADVFDGYLNYRPDWIAQWETQGQAGPLPAGLHPGATAWLWQGDLWCSLYPDIPLQQRSHRASRLQWLAHTLPKLDLAQQSHLPERLFVFGLHALPPAWLNLFLGLAQWIDIHWLVTNPSRYYWGDIVHPQQALRQQQAMLEKGLDESAMGDLFVEQNRLLASWGRAGRDYLSMIFQLDEREGFYESPADLYDHTSHNKALGLLQQDVRELSQSRHVINGEDQSIRFAACHSRLREVEALHDYLLDLLDRHSELSPRDILVMMPDVEGYAPLIRAVFSRQLETQNGDMAALPFAISDQVIANELPLFVALQEMLVSRHERLTLDTVFDWLENPAIHRRFGFDAQELPTLRRWLSRLQVRWGLDGKHRDELLEYHGSHDTNTWCRAIHRMLQGIIWGEPDSGNNPALYVAEGMPDAPSSMEEQRLVGKLCALLDALSSLHADLQCHYAPSQAIKQLAEHIYRLVDQESLDEQVAHLVKTSLESLDEELQWVELETIALQVLANSWVETIQDGRVSQRFLSGRINFCTLMPMRSIPFKVVAMIGMNEGSFPRQQTPNNFDLLQLDQRRTGDRSRRDDDRYLFLEALCSARDFLYISYEGFSAQDNSERFPSVLVAELRDYCAQHFHLDGDSALDADQAGEALLAHWTINHRLQPFHPAYFMGFSESEYASALPHSFAEHWLQHKPESDAQIHQKSPHTALPEVLALPELVAQAVHPLRAYYQQLGVVLMPLSEPDPETEPFVLDALSQYQLKTDIARSWLADGKSEQVLDAWRAQDLMPRAPVDTWQFEQCEDALTPMQHALSELSPVQKVDLAHTVAASTITGQFWHNPQYRIELHFSRYVETQLWASWCRHVLWNCVAHQCGGSGQSISLGPEHRICLPALAGETARAYAEALLAYAGTSLTEPQLFAPRTAYAQMFDSEAAARYAFWGGSAGFGMPGESEDAYWCRYEAEGHGAINSLEIMQAIHENHPLWQQVAAHKESIEIVKLADTAGGKG